MSRVEPLGGFLLFLAGSQSSQAWTTKVTSGHATAACLADPNYGISTRLPWETVAGTLNLHAKRGNHGAVFGSHGVCPWATRGNHAWGDPGKPYAAQPGGPATANRAGRGRDGKAADPAGMVTRLSNAEDPMENPWLMALEMMRIFSGIWMNLVVYGIYVAFFPFWNLAIGNVQPATRLMVGG